MDSKHIRPLVQALDAGFKYRPHQMLGFFISSILELWGVPEWQPIPNDVKARVLDAIGAYDQVVTTLPPFTDVLGPLYMELASRGARSHLGQFFSPSSIAEMMAEIATETRSAEHHEVVRVCDPACGSGVLLLAFAAKFLQRHGPDSLDQLSMTGCDIDGYCSRMCAIQMVANANVHRLSIGECLVYQGNSLGPTDQLQVVLHATSPILTNVSPANGEARLKALSTAAKAYFSQGRGTESRAGALEIGQIGRGM